MLQNENSFQTDDIYNRSLLSESYCGTLLGFPLSVKTISHVPVKEFLYFI